MFVANAGVRSLIPGATARADARGAVAKMRSLAPSRAPSAHANTRGGSEDLGYSVVAISDSAVTPSSASAVPIP